MECVKNKGILIGESNDDNQMIAQRILVFLANYNNLSIESATKILDYAKNELNSLTLSADDKYIKSIKDLYLW